MISTPDARLKSLGLVLPAIAKPRGNFRAYALAGATLYLSGKGAPVREDDAAVPKVGAEVSVQEARGYAQEVALYHLAVIKEALGGFDRVRHVVKVLGLVNATPDFTRHTEVIDGYSDLIVAVLGERGEHARSAIGVGSLPKGFAVEIEATIVVTAD
jgi:enamine deaminase RidA (YjgF/YER057c/UK114 family)